MTHSDTMQKVVAAISAVQAAVGGVTKNASNPHFGNKYTDLNGFLHALAGPLREHGLVVIQAPGLRDGWVTLETLIAHESGEWIRSEAGSPMPKADPQGAGSAITYLRRYSLASLFSLPQEDDDGNAGSNHTATAPRQAAPRQASHAAPSPPSGSGFSLDSNVGFGKFRDSTWRFLLANDPGYVEWAVANMEKMYPETREGLRAALANNEGAALAHDDRWQDG